MRYSGLGGQGSPDFVRKNPELSSDWAIFCRWSLSWYRLQDDDTILNIYRKQSRELGVGL
ncbi:hypothetical protein RA27_07610 [Ruegeria sp. ANG-R]|nr:hypothetical protein RA27_07610 [Ruegeria sp. ANG-R]